MCISLLMCVLAACVVVIYSCTTCVYVHLQVYCIFEVTELTLYHADLNYSLCKGPREALSSA